MTINFSASKTREKPNSLKKRLVIILCLILILPFWNIGKGVVHYSQGKARLKIIGHPSLEFANINQEYRIENQSIGCTFTGIEYLTSYSYNQTVKILIKRFGFQKNSYTGVIPTKEEALEILSTDENVIGKAAFIEADKIRIRNNLNVHLIDLHKQHGLFRKTIAESELNSSPKLKIIGECLIAQINNNWIYLIEFKRNKIIAQYRL